MDDDYRAAGCAGCLVIAFAGFALTFVVALFDSSGGENDADSPVGSFIGAGVLLAGVVFILAWIIVGLSNRD
jgi:hypothetical protein